MIYSVDDLELHTVLALRHLPLVYTQPPEAFRHTQSALLRVRSLAHPNVCRIHDVVVDIGGSLLVTMEYLSGCALSERLASRFGAEEALAIVCSISAALAAAHDVGIAHYGLRCTNVVLTAPPSSRIVVTDFGLARDEREAGPLADHRALGAVMRDMASLVPFALAPRWEGAARRLLGEAPRFHCLRELGPWLRGEKDEFNAPVTHNPYKGLRSFEPTDAADFFGREQLVSRLVAAVGERRFVAVVGPSGCGKSSVVKAGLLPALARGALPGSERWRIVVMVPGQHPLLVLDEALRAVPSGESLLVVVDQLEEIYTMAEESSAATFAVRLSRLVSDPTGMVRVVVTLRADFYDRPLLDPTLGALLRDATEVVLPLTPEELARAIEAPAMLAGARFAPGLAAAIAADFGERSAPPLLQVMLANLFEHRDGNRLTSESYRALGGLGGAVACLAEQICSSLDQTSETAAKRLFLSLLTLDEGGDCVRRRVALDELSSIVSPGLDRTVSAFVRARLLSFDRAPSGGGATVEVAHEALLREWPRLRAWVEEHRAEIRLARLLGAAAREWKESGEDDSFLLAGARLARYEGPDATAGMSLTGEQRRFLAASQERRRRVSKQADERRRLAEAEERQRVESKRTETLRRVRRTRVTASVFVALALAAAAMALLARSQQRDASAALARVEPFRDIAALDALRTAYATFLAAPPRTERLAEAVRMLDDWGKRLTTRIEPDRRALSGVSPTDNPHLHVALRKLVQDLEAVRAGDFPYGARRTLAAMAASVENPEYRKRWTAAVEDIARSPRYSEIPAIVPQPGLVPLGVDATSGLWEFAFLPSGQLPEWRDGHVVRTKRMAIVLVLLPACHFWMGAQHDDPTGRNYDCFAADSEEPVHEVNFAAPFLIGKYEVTQNQWQHLTGTNPSRHQSDGRREAADLPLPVEFVTWEEAQDLQRTTGLRLPSESEWEYAARGGSDTVYNFGDDQTTLADYAWFFHRNERSETHPVGEKKANGFGLHDVYGNVYELCQDAYSVFSQDYWGSPADGSSTESPVSTNHVRRGGSVVFDALACRSAARNDASPETRSSHLGLRLAYTVR